MNGPYPSRNGPIDNDAPVMLTLTVAQARYWRNVASHQASMARRQMIAKAADKEVLEAMDYLVKQSTILIDKINILLGDEDNAEKTPTEN